MHYNYIGQLAAVMNAAGWTQVELARELGVTFATLNRWLNRRATPHPAAQRIIHALYKAKVGILPLPDVEIKKALANLDREKNRRKNIKAVLRSSRQLREDLLLELTYNSNAIEGSTLTKKETEAIIFDKANIPDKSLIEHLEAANHAAALERIFDGEFDGPVSEKTIKKLHGIILQGIGAEAGKYSRHHRAIRGVDLALPSPEDIQEEMDCLLKRINQPGQRHIVEHIARMHAAFEAIHPFGDGNGRTGRLIMSLALLDADYAPCVVENSRKAEYYDALEYAQRRSESHLVKFLIESVLKGYQIFRKHRK